MNHFDWAIITKKTKQNPKHPPQMMKNYTSFFPYFFGNKIGMMKAINKIKLKVKKNKKLMSNTFFFWKIL
jgi:hypothetical protein